MCKSGLIIDDNWSFTNNRKPTYINSEFPRNVSEMSQTWLLNSYAVAGVWLAAPAVPALPLPHLVLYFI